MNLVLRLAWRNLWRQPRRTWLTTGAMVRLGKTYGNLMVDLAATSEKLRGRAERIVMEAGRVGREEARRCLREADGRAGSSADQRQSYASAVVDRLRAGGSFVTKLFQGEGADAYIAGARRCFENVKVRKPKASRPRSREVYLVARNYRV